MVGQVREVLVGLVRSVEFLLVDDGSPDDTWHRLGEICSRNPDVQAIRLSRNFGQHNALLAGLRLATGDLILTMDDDLQHPPDQIPLLFDSLDESCDLVYGHPNQLPHSRFRNLATTATKRVANRLIGDAVNPRHSAFRLFDRRLVGAAQQVADPSVSLDVILSWATTRQHVVVVRADPRRSGDSGYDLRKLLRHALNLVTGFGTAPLRFVTWLGFALSILGAILAMFVIGRFLLGGSRVAGFTFLASAISLFAGAQLLGMGILGQYVGRIHYRSMGKPTYLVAEHLNRPASE